MASTREAIAEAVRQRVISGLHFGTLQPGQRLPSARALAEEFDADARSVTAAYRRLERDGLVIRRPPSRGFYLAPMPSIGRVMAPGDEWLVELIVGALFRGVPVPEFPDFVRRSLETLRLRAVCLECNDDQEQWLCRELQENFGFEATGMSLQQMGEREPELRRTDLLVTTPEHIGEVEPVAERVGRPVVVASLREDLAREIDRLLRSGPLYFIGTDPRLADKLRRQFRDRAGARNLRTVILGHDDVAGIPQGSPAYVWRTARDRLGGTPPNVSSLATLRAFSAETARAIVRLVVGENLRAAAARSGPEREAASRMTLAAS